MLIIRVLKHPDRLTIFAHVAKISKSKSVFTAVRIFAVLRSIFTPPNQKHKPNYALFVKKVEGYNGAMVF
jgi:hypothetical protein